MNVFSARFAILSLLLLGFNSHALPFSNLNCQPSKLNDGIVCIGNSINDVRSGFKFSQPVVVLVPHGVVQPSRVLLHFQGYRNVCGDDTTAQFIDKFGVLELMQYLKQQNAIGIFPRSAGKETTYKNEFVPRFSKFLDWVYFESQTSSMEWIISGHSGAYIPVGSVLAQQDDVRLKIKSVVMLDATYSQNSSYYAQWNEALRTNPKIKVWSIFRANTRVGTEMLAKKLKSYSNLLNAVEDRSPHCGIPKKHLSGIIDELSRN